MFNFYFFILILPNNHHTMHLVHFKALYIGLVVCADCPNMYIFSQYLIIIFMAVVFLMGCGIHSE